MCLTAFTLFVLFTGLQNIPVTTAQQQSLSSQTFLCLLVPICALYFSRIALTDYIKIFYSFGGAAS